MQSSKNWSYRTFGGGGDNFGSLGQKVSVEAQTTIAKGDRFFGIKNSGDTSKTLVTSPIGSAIEILSEDLSVGIARKDLGDGEQLPIYFLNEENKYDTYLLTIPNVSEVRTALGYSSTFSSYNMKINEDGTYAFIDFNSTSSKKTQGLDHYLGLITFDKKAKTADFKIIKNPLGDVSFKITNTSGVTYDLDKIISLDKASIHDNILICNMYCFVNNGSTTTTTTVQAIIELPSFKIKYRGGYASGITNIQTSVKTENGYYILGGSNTIYKFSNSEYIGSSSATTFRAFSKGGKYACAYDNSKGNYSIYSIDSVGLGATLLYTKTGISYISYAYPSEDGTMVLTSGGIYNETGKLHNSTAAPSNGKFTPNRWVSGSNIHSLSPSTDAEYLISKTESYGVESDKIYGIASEDLLVGAKGTAQRLFETIQ